MKFVIAGASGLEFISSGFIAQAQAQETAPAGEPALVDSPPPIGEAAPIGHGETAPAGDDSHGATTNAGEVEHHEGGTFPPFDTQHYTSTLFWLIVTFGLFYLFLKRVVMPRLASIIDTREGRIAQDLEQANRAKADADAAVAAYEQALAEARGKAATIGQHARDAAKADAEAERKQTEAGLDARLAESQARIDEIKASAMGEVGAIATDTAEAIVQALTGKDADRKAVEAAVNQSRS